MEEYEGLTPPQQKYLWLRATGKKREEAASDSGMSLVQARLLEASDSYRIGWDRAGIELAREGIGGLRGLVEQAIGVLGEAMGGEDGRLRLSAAMKVLELAGIKAVGAMSIEAPIRREEEEREGAVRAANMRIAMVRRAEAEEEVGRALEVGGGDEIEEHISELEIVQGSNGRGRRLEIIE